MFEGFTRTEIETGGARIVTVHGGKGPPILLMHGNPFTHACWHLVAPVLARDFTVVCTDLRGYGDSSKPPDGDNHANYSFRAMAQDNVEVMAKLGFKKFCAAGHDRGAWGLFSWHWFFMAQAFDIPERMMGADPEFYIRRKLGKGPAGLKPFAPEALAEYIRCFKNPATIHGMCEDYRATFGIDLDMDNADFAAGRKITLPVLLLWGANGGVGRNHKSMEIWPHYASDIRGGKALPSGHYVPEEAPNDTAAELRGFFKQ